MLSIQRFIYYIEPYRNYRRETLILKRLKCHCLLTTPNFNKSTESNDGTIVFVFVNKGQTGCCMCMYTRGHLNKSNENFVNGLESHMIPNRHGIWSECLSGSPEIKNKANISVPRKTLVILYKSHFIANNHVS